MTHTRRAMPRMLLPLAAAMLLAAIPSCVSAQAPVTAEDLRDAVYSYDAALPLNPAVKEMPSAGEQLAALRTRFAVQFDSVHDQHVTAIYTMPRKFAPPYPAVVLLHGSGGHKDSDYVRIASDMFSTMGYATISIDAQYRGDRTRPGRSGDIHLIDQDVNRDAWIQTVVDLRRAVDFLMTRKAEVDTERIGFLGFSQGAMLGAVFIGVEPRLKVACLAVAGGGFPEWGKALKLWKDAPARKVEINAYLTDPVNFIGKFSPKPLLLLSAKRDEMIPVFAAEALHAAAKEPKTVKWYNTGHILTPTALIVDAKQFFRMYLGEAKPLPK